MLDKIIKISIKNLSISQIQISKNIIILINTLFDCPSCNIFNTMKEHNKDKFAFKTFMYEIFF
jgi:hypothetical protein